MNSIYKIILCLYVINCTGFLAAQEQYIFWTDNHSMYRGTIDGSSYTAEENDLFEIKSGTNSIQNILCKQ